MIVMTGSNKFFHLILSACLWAGFFVCPYVQAQDTAYHKIDDLIRQAKDFDGKEIVIKGEVIGDIMPRQKGYLWFNVQDPTGVIGIWVHGELAREILVAGDYNYQGDEIEISGVFVRADPELSGETCVRAKSIDILKRGHRIEHLLNPIKIKIAAVLAVLAGILLLLRMMIQHKK